MKKLALICLTLLLAGCGEDSAKRAIEAHGFADVTLTGSVLWGCSESDDFFWNSKFAAKAVNGRRVTGVVCGGALKGWTVRID
jgi:hypothetical protein